MTKNGTDSSHHQRDVALLAVGLSVGWIDARLRAGTDVQPLSGSTHIPLRVQRRIVRHTAAALFVRRDSYSHRTEE